MQKLAVLIMATAISLAPTPSVPQAPRENTISFLYASDAATADEQGMVKSTLYAVTLPDTLPARIARYVFGG